MSTKVIMTIIVCVAAFGIVAIFMMGMSLHQALDKCKDCPLAKSNKDSND